jgi:hypothetical protein
MGCDAVICGRSLSPDHRCNASPLRIQAVPLERECSAYGVYILSVTQCKTTAQKVPILTVSVASMKFHKKPVFTEYSCTSLFSVLLPKQKIIHSRGIICCRHSIASNWNVSKTVVSWCVRYSGNTESCLVRIGTLYQVHMGCAYLHG